MIFLEFYFQKFHQYWVNQYEKQIFLFLPFLKYVAVGAEDRHVYIFDTRKFAGAHVGKIAAVPDDSMSMAKSPITDVAFRPKTRSSMKLQLIASSLDGYLFEFGE